ncbi:MAG: SDR family oxidoreductase [Verrucomicrobiota bacterium]|jgi:nucleoside-diphosphate-sugar epimerase
MKADVFVTGATGFIGTRLVQELLKEGRKVRALCRPSSNCEGLNHPNVELVPGDILDPHSLKKGMEGCRAVFHLAAYAKNWAPDPKHFFRLNVEGACNVFDAAQAVGVDRLVFTSTIVTLGPRPADSPTHEGLPRVAPKFFTEYEETKTQAEQEALRRAASGFPIVIVNPTRVYGPGKLTEGNSVTLMVDLYHRGRLPVLLNEGRNIGNYVFVDDLVQGHLLAMEKGRPGERYILGGENVSLNQFFRLVDEVSGQSRVQFNFPPRVALWYAALQKKKAEWFGSYPQITPGWVETFLADWPCTSAKAERELGYRITPLREGLRITWNWLQENRGKRA